MLLSFSEIARISKNLDLRSYHGLLFDTLVNWNHYKIPFLLLRFFEKCEKRSFPKLNFLHRPVPFIKMGGKNVQHYQSYNYLSLK